jgi:hypothetical protein
MQTFDHLLNWTLKKGSHRFPGPDGGTCINDAAVVAAGFPYARLRTVESMPACFSRPICRLAMMLNDLATDAERQRLLPYVPRLACTDTPEVERERADYISRRLRQIDDRDLAMGATMFPAGGGAIVTGWSLPSFEQGLATLDGALAIGRQADAFPTYEVEARLEVVRAKAAPRELRRTSSFVSTMTSWLTVNESA